MASRNLVDLARIISDSVAKLNIYLHDEGKPQPSFDINAPPNFPALSPELMSIRSTALAASHDLHTLLLGPTEHLLNSSGEVSHARSLKESALRNSDSTSTYLHCNLSIDIELLRAFSRAKR
jgi:hypothetical protein